MKRFQNILITALLAVFALACKDGYIDDISKVEPGADESAPQIGLRYPTEGTQIQLPEAVSAINIRFEVTDDIEIDQVEVLYDGTSIATYTDFKDYRRLVVDSLIYDNVVDGSHSVTIKATDIENKTTTLDVNFEKVPPYLPKYQGELLYMPFDGDYMDMITFETATVVGNPGFSDESVVGLKSYAGAAGSYLTFPAERFQNQEFTAVFWMKVNPSPDRAGILVMGPPDPDNPDSPNNRTSGFRFFREDAGGEQRFKLNAGNGTADSWFDGGDAADVDPSVEKWRHFAFTISNSEAVVYIDGEVVKQGAFDGIDWAGCDILSIMSGAPRWTGWDHWSDESLMDELRIFDRALSQEEIQNIITDESDQEFLYSGMTFYMPFENSYVDAVSQTEATVVGSPGFEDGIVGSAYAGDVDSYLTFPADNLTTDQFSASFWMKVNPDPDRAGILVMGPPDEENPDAQNNRNNGFRFFREAAGEEQRFKLNVGTGDGETWFDGGDAADVDPATNEWRHFAFTISDAEAVVYIDGEVVKQDEFAGIDWTGVDILSIMSGAPRFTGWDHLSDLSLMDELRLFNKALTQEEVQGIMLADM
jgi:hypothetical protein